MKLTSITKCKLQNVISLFQKNRMWPGYPAGECRGRARAPKHWLLGATKVDRSEIITFLRSRPGDPSISYKKKVKENMPDSGRRDTFFGDIPKGSWALPNWASELPFR